VLDIITYSYPLLNIACLKQTCRLNVF
jgi:hypothetical protein